ncbi:MAG TPA: CHAD domain-containing protein [Kiritimatiellia bacterium]|nr:CHAD domain-containing protein [Kiritimatiellia bacterium]HMO97571.1 CHAD domain-containing protein [Kiritimatiellia bacterium]HMP95943.1 CHAD domain-containing protein [Kiritimatiellia bacterium]
MNGRMGESVDVLDRDAATPRRLAAQQLFACQGAEFRRLAEAWRSAPDDEEALHRLRIGLRRFRVLLRVFEADTLDHGGRTLRASLSALGDRLGVVRDHDVMLAQLRKAERKLDDSAPEEVAAVESRLRVRRQAAWRKVQGGLRGRAWIRTFALTDRFVARFAADPPETNPQTVGGFFDKEFKKHVRKIRRSAALADAVDVESLHQFRIRLRRLRYLGDLFAPLADRRLAKTITLVHDAEQSLGRVHDLDLALAFLDGQAGLRAVGLRAHWEGLRARRLRRFQRAWAICRRRL